MDRLRRTSSLRRVAVVGTLAALLVPAATAEAASKKVKYPVITSVSPMSAKVGDTLLIKGKNFKRGKRKNSVGFKADGFAVVFVKSDVSTTKRIYVKVPKRLEKVMNTSTGVPTATRFHLSVLAARLTKRFTTNKLSPKIAPAPPAASGGTSTGGTPTGGGTGTTGGGAPSVDARGPEGDCDADGIKNKDETDDDDDLLSDDKENAIGTDGCMADSDSDGVPDGYEYQSAVDLNDDVYQSADTPLPYPGKRPYPNALDDDAKTDYDGDGLSLKSEYDLWTYTWKVAKTDARTLSPLSYSDGKQYSKAIAPSSYDKWSDFLAWAASNGYRNVNLQDHPWDGGFVEGVHSYGLLDVDRVGGEDSSELNILDRDGNGKLADDERDEDADGLSNIAELVSRMTPGYWSACYTAEPEYPVHYAGTSATDPDSDGDGVRDGADDQDHDDVPNIMETSRFAASGYAFDETDDKIDGTVTGGGTLCKADKDLKVDDLRHPNDYGQVNPFNPCLPDTESRTCGRNFEFGTLPAPFSGPVWWALQ